MSKSKEYLKRHLIVANDQYSRLSNFVSKNANEK